LTFADRERLRSFLTIKSIGAIGRIKVISSSSVRIRLPAYLVKRDSNPETILKIVVVGAKSYKVFTQFLSEGKLILAEDYLDRPRAVIDRTYIKVPAPTVESTISPDKYLSEKGVSPSKCTRGPVFSRCS